MFGEAASRTPASRKIGSGGPSRTIHQHDTMWSRCQLTHAIEEITKPTDWKIENEDCHTLIVHLGGYMKELATEVEGRFGSIGPATPGEIWSVPAGMRYASFAQGKQIEFAVIRLPIDERFNEIALLAGVRDDYLFAEASRLVRLAACSDDASAIESEAVSHSVREHVYNTYSSADGSKAERPRLDTNQARLLREFVWDNLSEKISLSQIAGIVGMTTHHLLIAFRDLFGMTPAQYLICQRLRRAQWLLLYSQRDITSIALETGFSSHSHLTSTFQRRLGRAPVDFRRHHL